MNQTTTIIIAVAIAAIVGFGAGWVLSPDGDGGRDTRIMISGSTTVQPLMDAWQVEYEKDHSVAMYISGGGSGAGRNNARDGISDIGMASSSTNLTTYNTLKEYRVAYDGVVVVVSNNISLDNLTTAQLKEIFEAGSEKTWADYGGNGDITILVREDGSGTRDSFNGGVGITGAYKAGAQEMNAAGGILNYINTNSNCIGYVNMNSLDDIAGGTAPLLFPNVKAIKVNGVVANADNVKKSQDSDYATGTAYPLSRSLFVLVKDGNLTGETYNLVKWMYGSEAQNIAGQSGFVGLTQKHIDAGLAAVG
ncbi:MAG: substrate-binding domain-containing protein [Methanomassiliicoccaceae archaeon]|nr:substrate-binding domain-containing protein [Methanomassiliicoccaceae archaeon]